MRSIAIIAILLSIDSVSFADITYPTSATVQIKDDNMNKVFKVIYNSTQTVDAVALINELADKINETWMVLPSSYVSTESQPWIGYCLNKVAVKCP
jgi:hypothetical protein